jgi:3',5'-cyclic AMP phosphodiesterase CpdA
MEKILIISDIHMRNNHEEDIRSKFEDTISSINEDEYEKAFILGDLIEDEDKPYEDKKNIRKIRSMIDNMDLSFKYLLGNHDVEKLSTLHLKDLLEQDSFYNFDSTLNSTNIIYLDSSLPSRSGPHGWIDDIQLKWLEEKLSEIDNAFILIHHPIADYDIQDNYWFSDYPERAYLLNRKEVIKKLNNSDTNIRGVLNGHIHQNSYTDFHEIPNISINAFSKETREIPVTGTYAELILKQDNPDEINIMIEDEVIESYSF